MAHVELEQCDASHLTTLTNLFQLYVHDFSELWAGQARGELSEAGLFESYPGLHRFVTESGRSAWLIRADGRVAGFALLGSESHSGEPADYDMAEFFVVRKHRRGGVGFAAALQLIRPRPGRWEIAVARGNGGALAFWRQVAQACSASVHERDLNDEHWNGSNLRFVVA